MIAISLVLPTGVVVTQSNASSYGFEWDTANISVEPDGSGGGASLSTPQGRHDLVRFPAGQAVGTYGIRVSRETLGDPVGFVTTMSYHSGVRFGLTVKEDFHIPSQPVTVVGIVLEDANPVSSASIEGSVRASVPQTTGVSLTNWQQQSKTELGNGKAQYVYSVALQNTSSPFHDFRATARVEDELVTIQAGEVVFRDVPQGQVVQCAPCLSYVGPSSPEPSPGNFTWSVYAAPTEIPIILYDSTAEYPTPGDGVFSGSFTTPYTGNHWISLKAEGEAAGQRPFVRETGTSVLVQPRSAYFLGISDAPFDSDGDGHPDEIVITASVHVNEAGVYSFSTEWLDETGARITAGARGELDTGTQQLVARIPVTTVLNEFSGDGPYQRARSTLLKQSSAETDVADFIENTGPSQSYTLSSFQTGRLHLGAPAVLIPIDIGGSSAYELLRLTMEVINPYEGSCGWDALLVDSEGRIIERKEGGEFLAAGANTVEVDFSGALIAKHGIDGPYTISRVTVTCQQESIYKSNYASTGPLAASAFDNSPGSFDLDIPALGIVVGETRIFVIQVAGRNAFDEAVEFSIANLPAGVSAVFGSRALPGSGTSLTISAESSVTPGQYPIQITGASNSVTKSYPIVLSVTREKVVVHVDPHTSFLHPGMTKQLNAWVENASTQNLTWSLISPNVGSINTNGVYTPPVSIARQDYDTVIAKSPDDPSSPGVGVIALYPPVTIKLTPQAQSVAGGQEVEILAELENVADLYSKDWVSWTLDPPSTPAIRQLRKLTYTAPSIIETTRTITVTARCPDDPAAIAVATITLLPGIGVSILPSSVDLQASSSYQFSAVVLHDDAQAGVTYSLSPNIGTVTAAGLYTAPSVVSQSINVILTATSVSDPTRKATATIALVAGISVTISPSEVTLPAGGRRQFIAEALNDDMQAGVAYSLSPEIGTIDENGLYTAPLQVSQPVIVMLTATSVADPTRSNSATITLTTNISLSVSPSTVQLTAGGAQQFAAVVLHDSQSGGVTYSLSPNVGSIAVDGRYTAPEVISTATTVTLTVASVSDPTRTATATITLVPSIVVSLIPSTTNLYAGESQQFTATVLHDPAAAGVTYSLSPNVGTVSASGMYTAPAIVSSPMTVVLTAKSVSDPSRSATATIGLAPLFLPESVSVTPGSGVGAEASLTALYRDMDGAADIRYAYLVVGSPASPAANCAMRFDENGGQPAISLHTGGNWSTPQLIGSGGVISNPQCSVRPAQSSFSRSGTDLSVTFKIEFVPAAFSGAKSVHLAAQDFTSGGSAIYHQLATWTVTSGNTAPVAQAVSPASGGGSEEYFIFNFSDADGFSDLSTVEMGFSSSTSKSNACFFRYERAANQLRWYQDDGSTLSAAFVPGTAGVYGNSQCKALGELASVTVDGQTLQVKMLIDFTDTWTGSRSIYVQAWDNAAASTGLVVKGSWTISNVSSLPTYHELWATPWQSGQGATQLFRSEIRDYDGGQDFGSVSYRFGQSTPSAPYVGSCMFRYYRKSGAFALMADDGISWQGVGFLGQSGTLLQNSQCSINLGAVSSGILYGDSGLIYLQETIGFKPSFGSSTPKRVDFKSQDARGHSFGWTDTYLRWTVPVQ